MSKIKDVLNKVNENSSTNTNNSYVDEYFDKEIERAKIDIEKKLISFLTLFDDRGQSEMKSTYIIRILRNVLNDKTIELVKSNL